MPKIFPGRMTHHHEGELVVFHIGMRINKLWRPDLWLPVLRAMGPMLIELSKDPDSGLLGFTPLFGRNGPYIVQYWSSIEKLYAYASNQDAAHRPAWTAFNAKARKAPAAVGIWHETFHVERAETMYVGMPKTGLPAATEHVAVTPRGNRARDRYAVGRTTGAAG
ncbi:DUF4188 domain-containing protein [Schumannella luteola]|uniref:DUF4188 domain-containing protein n=1 Tax=Schumannella luteola TaxID=472059 RepID=A0A852YKH2_9MICO|nr:DUF4188 domain-containing protein [Schumannella luteola]NYG98229.1 hypothetical protein [Schumannella luteola]TPX02155.1 DUF4188 domain-containing protein [Schumannella luteola]